MPELNRETEMQVPEPRFFESTIATVTVRDNKVVFGSGFRNIDSDGSITVAAGTSLHLTVASTYSLAGIKFHDHGPLPVVQTNLPRIPPFANTLGKAELFDSCLLVIRTGLPNVLQLIDNNVFSRRYFYSLGVILDNGRALWSDPAIYNMGGGPLPPSNHRTNAHPSFRTH